MRNRKRFCPAPAEPGKRGPKYRNEWKYLISEPEKELLKLRMASLFRLDPNAPDGGYLIRSLYFDDYWDSAFEEKEMGVLARKKYRIRIYTAVTGISSWSGKRRWAAISIRNPPP